MFETSFNTPLTETNFFFPDGPLIVASTNDFAALDLINTCPFSDLMVPSFSIRLANFDSETFIFNLPLDDKDNFALSPDTIAAVPDVAEIKP